MKKSDAKSPSRTARKRNAPSSHSANEKVPKTPPCQLALFNPSPTETPFRLVLKGDARDLSSVSEYGPTKAVNFAIPDNSVDLIVTSPPYWKKRDYGFPEQIGQERTPDEFVEQIAAAMRSWRRVLRPTASIFLNIGDTYWKKSLQGIPHRVEDEARKLGWKVRNRIIWYKKSGMPDPARDRLASRHEYVFHFSIGDYYYDLFGYAELYSADGRGANPGDVWELGSELELGEHLAPFPTEIARRSILLACPQQVCIGCGKPRTRVIERTHELDLHRPQARRAVELAKEHNLTKEHLEAIRATGISDAGKARFVQTGTDRNSARIVELATEAKAALGGYFREFTFAKKRSVGWSDCGCGLGFTPGVVLDPFMGTGTTLDVANEMGRSAIGVDLSKTACNHL